MALPAEFFCPHCSTMLSVVERMPRKPAKPRKHAQDRLRNISDANVREIRTVFAQGLAEKRSLEVRRELAAKYGLTLLQVQRIVEKHLFGHVK